MGQRTSRSSSTTGGGQAQPTFLLMEFARLWLGGDLPELSVARLPSSWDELLDWSEDAEKMSVVISSSSASHSRQNMHRVLQIVPLVDSRERHRVESLASIPPIEQADFFADAVSSWSHLVWILYFSSSRSNTARVENFHSTMACRLL